MDKEKTLWQLILDIILYIFTRKKKVKEQNEKIKVKQQEQFKHVVKDLDNFYNNTDEKKHKKQDDVEDISNRINRRF